MKHASFCVTDQDISITVSCTVCYDCKFLWLIQYLYNNDIKAGHTLVCFSFHNFMTGMMKIATCKMCWIDLWLKAKKGYAREGELPTIFKKKLKCYFPQFLFFNFFYLPYEIAIFYLLGWYIHFSNRTVTLTYLISIILFQFICCILIAVQNLTLWLACWWHV